MTPPSTDSARERTRGFLYALAAFTVWGLSPIYWKQIQALEPDRLLAHRIVWSALLLLVWLGWQGRLRGLAGRLGRPRTLATLAASTVFIGINWFVYIWSVANARILEASLGYFINPLVAVLLGMLVLGERLRPLQWLSVALAAIGVILLTARVGHLPWVSLVLAGSFGIYGLLRKTVDATADEGLALETWLLTPLALGWLAFGPAPPAAGGFGIDPLFTLLVVGTGALTTLPLAWFTHGARRLPLSTVGLLQYLAPTGQFLLAVWVYDEPFDLDQLTAFAFIWSALVFFSIDLRRASRRPRPPADCPADAPRIPADP